MQIMRDENDFRYNESILKDENQTEDSCIMEKERTSSMYDKKNKILDGPSDFSQNLRNSSLKERTNTLPKKQIFQNPRNFPDNQSDAQSEQSTYMMRVENKDRSNTQQRKFKILPDDSSDAGSYMVRVDNQS